MLACQSNNQNKFAVCYFIGKTVEALPELHTSIRCALARRNASLQKKTDKTMNKVHQN